MCIRDRADGGMRDALSIFDRIASSSDGKIEYDDLVQKLNLLDQDYYFRMVDALATQDKAKVLLLFNEVLMNGFEGDHFVMGLADHFRNILLCKDSSSVALLEASETIKAQYLNQAQLLSSSYLMTALHLCNECDINYPKAKNKRLHVEIALLKICYSNQLIEHQPTASKVLEKKTPDLNSSTKTPAISTPNEKPKLKPPVAEDDSPKTEIVEEKREKTPELVSESAAVPQTTQAAAPAATGLQNTPSFANVDSLLAKVKKDYKEEEALKGKEIKLEDILTVWHAYRDQTTVPSTRGVLEKSMLDLSEEGLKITVASVIAKEIIQQEIPLMQEIRKEIKNAELDIEIIVDKTQFPEIEVSKPKKYLGFKEKYDLMVEKNSALEQLIKKLELKKDNNAI